MTITDIYYADTPVHRGVWIVFKINGEEGFRPIDLETAKVLKRKLHNAIVDTEYVEV